MPQIFKDIPLNGPVGHWLSHRKHILHWQFSKCLPSPQNSWEHEPAFSPVVCQTFYSHQPSWHDRKKYQNVCHPTLFNGMENMTYEVQYITWERWEKFRCFLPTNIKCCLNYLSKGTSQVRCCFISNTPTMFPELARQYTGWIAKQMLCFSQQQIKGCFS